MPLDAELAEILCPEALRGGVTGPLPGPESARLAEILRRFEAPAAHGLSRGETPPFWDRAEACLVWDVDGNRFLDLAAGFGVAAVGHRHPRVVEAVQTQAARLGHGFGDVHPHGLRAQLAARLADLAPFPEAQAIFAQSGAEAIELALKTAHLATGKAGVVAFEGGYHGESYGALSVTGFERFRAPWAGEGPAHLGPRATFAPYAGDLSAVDHAFADAEARFGGVGAMLLEPILGRGGAVVPSDDWLVSVAEMARAREALVIVDEIYTGLGRIGARWASEAAGLIPDLLCTGKALGGGYPIAACLLPARLGAVWDHAAPAIAETPYATTFYAHPVACAAALATLDVLHDEDLFARAGELGESLHGGLAELARLHPDLVADVRGRGLLAALALRRPVLTAEVTRAALEQGLIVLPSGMRGEALSLSPPYVLDTRQLGWGLAVLDDVLQELEGEPVGS